ncbi:hypothetical protein ABI59_07235 [Acidobacteria bacterium Mor1]|nr:hypothetical protein ABI59_07235 [Acidobacteria bacterium Mor1]
MWAFWSLLGVVSIAAVIDVRTREVPHWVWVAALLIAAARVATGSIGWLTAGSGLLLGLVIVSLLYAFAGFGGGDVKLVGALAASVGPLGFLNLLIYIALAGGVLALWALARKRDDFAYVPAIAVGLLAYVWRFET